MADLLGRFSQSQGGLYCLTCFLKTSLTAHVFAPFSSHFESFIIPMASSLPPYADELRRFDRERFFTALFAQSSGREALLTLYAFNLDLALIRERVREPLAGHMRLQWWRDALEPIFAGHPPGHPVAEALSALVHRRSLPRSLFEDMIDARERDLDTRPPADIPDLLAYAEHTSGALSELAVLALGGQDAAAHELGRRAGMAWALTGLLRAVAHHAGSGRVWLPADRMAELGIYPHDLAATGSREALALLAAEIAGKATALLAFVGQAQENRALLPALLPATLARAHLRNLARRNFDLFDPAVARVNTYPLRCLWSFLKGRA